MINQFCKDVIEILGTLEEAGFFTFRLELSIFYSKFKSRRNGLTKEASPVLRWSFESGMAASLLNGASSCFLRNSRGLKELTRREQ